MNEDNPLISILIPVHNSEVHLSESIKSILAQSYQNLEILIIDDFSSDNSFKILKSFARIDKRIKLKRNVKRYGIGITLNRLLVRAKGNFMAFMDAEDRSAIDRLKKQLNFLMTNSNITAVGSQCYFLNQNEKRIGKSKFPLMSDDIHKSPLHGISMQFETILLNRSHLPKDLLKFNTKSHPFIYSDMFLKLLTYGKVANLPNFLHYHRKHPNEYFRDLRKNPISFVKLWIKSTALYNYNSPMRSFFAPLIKQAR